MKTIDELKLIYTPRVARGARRLDRVRPGWAVEIDRDRMAMELCRDCVFGQLYGHYLKGVGPVLGRPRMRRWRSAIGYGFQLLEAWPHQKQTKHRWAALNDVWREAIRVRSEESNR